MCAGLPCVGHKVRLTREIIREERTLKEGAEGTVEKEDIDARRVQVYFARYDLLVWVPEDYLVSMEDLG